ncbi:MAG TPA: DUF4476 domain-containing protein [Bacteroidia bacterium]|nr:DUF4476 domain-containing protein [Bacteroidia bacterium]HRH09059.1 DUF4476 domain-containing protein [Bacteroidia bacterium]
MKKTILLSTMLFLTLSNIYAFDAPSILNLRLANNGEFAVSLDGNYYSTNRIQRLPNIFPGKHYLEVYSKKWVQQGHYGSYVTKKIYQGSILIDECSEIFATIFKGNFVIDRIESLPFQYQQWELSPSSCNPHGIHHQQTVYSTNNCGSYGMNNRDFEGLLNVIENASFESSKLSIATNALQTNNFTSLQVKTLVSLFSFESTKVNFAKSAYERTVDKNNYYLVYDEFSFNSSVNDLSNFLASR